MSADTKGPGSEPLGVGLDTVREKAGLPHPHTAGGILCCAPGKEQAELAQLSEGQCSRWGFAAWNHRVMQGPLTGQPLLSPLSLQVVNSSLSILPYALCCMEDCKWP